MGAEYEVDESGKFVDPEFPPVQASLLDEDVTEL